MTESDWLRCQGPGPLLNCVSGWASARKFRLFAVACCRRIEHLFFDQSSRDLVDAAERLADGEEVPDLVARLGGYDPCLTQNSDTAWAAFFAAHVEALHGARLTSHAALARADRRDQERLAQSRLVRDIIGNPFRPACLEAHWRTSTALALAQAIYHERSFDLLPILGDVLEEAGCAHPAILEHCRQDGGHVRGCWLVDKLLGKG